MTVTLGHHEDSSQHQVYADIELSRLSLQQQERLLSDDDQVTNLYSKPPTRWERWKQQFTKDNLRALAYEKRWSLVMIGVFVLMGLLTYHYRREFFETLEYISHQLAGMGYGGYILMAFLIFLSSFPPVMGYGTYQTLSGFTYGFGVGFVISYFSALIGAMTCFQLSRVYLGEERIQRLMNKSHSLKALIKAVDKKGFKLFLLIRFSPYPYNLMNVLFATTPITLAQFTLGTGISLIKIALHVYVGANLTSFAKHLLGEEDGDMTEGEMKAEKVKFYGALVLSSLAFVVLVYVYYVARKVVNEEEQQGINMGEEEEEQMAFLRHHDEEEGFLEDSEQDEVADPIDDDVSLDNWDTWEDNDNKQESTANDPAIKKGLGKSD